MGFKIAWIACRGKSYETVLRDLGLAKTGEFEEISEAEYNGLRLPSGLVVVVNNFAVGDFMLSADLSRLMAGAEVITCYVHEGTMMSHIAHLEDGREDWSITHDCEKGVDHLEVVGTPPEPFTDIRDRLTAAQQDEVGGGVDHMFDLVPRLGEALTGFHHARDIEGLGNKPFELLEPRKHVPWFRRFFS